MGENSERRVFPRHPCTGAADILLGGKRWGWGKVSDISRGGCYIETEHTLPIGTEVQLQLTIAGILLDAIGKVACTTSLVGMGLNFVGISPELETRLAQLIEKVTAPNRPPDAQKVERSQPGSPTLRITREAAPDILAKVIKRINEKGVLTRQEVVEIVKASQ
jgi:hypothetical protein